MTTPPRRTMPLSVLIVEDRESDAKLLVRELCQGGFDLDFERVDTPEAMRFALERRTWQVILSDWSMPRFDALTAFSLLRERQLDIPFIIISGTIGEETAVEALKAGANDFMLKHQLSRLVPAIERELREAENRRERRDAERQLRALFEGAMDAMLIADDQHRYVDANPAACALLGVPRDRLIGMRLDDFAGPHGPALDALWQGFLRDGHLEGEFEFHCPGGRVRVAEFRGNAHILPGRHLSVLRDVTEAKQLRNRVAIADRMASIGTLAAGVAHEINNPLAYVNANVSFAVAGLEAAAGSDAGRGLGEVLEALQQAQEGVGRIRTTVRDLKTFTRGDEERRAPVDVNQVLNSSCNMVWNEIRHRALLVKELGDVPPVDGNESKLGQVFLNLLVNAVQAIPEGQSPRHAITVRSYRQGDAVHVSVTDTGVGIAPEHMPHLFETFFTTKPIGVGTGLGLSLCHSIISGFGGELTVQSVVGAGSTFTVVLPVGILHEAAVAPLLPASATAQRARVLIVDDEPMLVRALVRLLAPLHQTTGLTDAGEALALLEAGERFDVIFCDVMMPGMTGMELHQAVLRVSEDQARRIVFLSGGAFTPKAREFLEQVSNHQIDKPWDPKALLALVGQVMS